MVFVERKKLREAGDSSSRSSLSKLAQGKWLLSNVPQAVSPTPTRRR